MNELLKQIAEICDKHNLPKQAFVIDDEWEQRESPDPVAWEEFTQTLSTESNFLAILTASIRSKGFDLASAVPAQIINQLFSELAVC